MAQTTNTDTPRDAATLVIVDRSGDCLRFLMGQRRKQQVFLPDKYVFPGGRVDTQDAAIQHDGALSPDALHNLLYDMKGPANSQRATAIALAALRETYEEAGLLFGAPHDDGSPAHSNDVWPAFHQAGLRPSLEGLSFFARAITPPGRPRRYDTRFFTVDASLIAKRIPPPDDELRNLDWFTLDDLQNLDILNITRKVLHDLIEWDRCQRLGLDTPPVPYYFYEDGSRQRVLVPRGQNGLLTPPTA